MPKITPVRVILTAAILSVLGVVMFNQSSKREPAQIRATTPAQMSPKQYSEQACIDETKEQYNEQAENGSQVYYFDCDADGDLDIVTIDGGARTFVLLDSQEAVNTKTRERLSLRVGLMKAMGNEQDLIDYARQRRGQQNGTSDICVPINDEFYMPAICGDDRYITRHSKWGLSFAQNFHRLKKLATQTRR